MRLDCIVGGYKWCQILLRQKDTRSQEYLIQHLHRTRSSLELRKQLYDHYMTEALRWAKRLAEEPARTAETLEGELGELQFFSLPSGVGPH